MFSVERRNNDEIVEKMDKIKVEANWQRRDGPNGWRSLWLHMKICGIDEDICQ